MDGWKDVTWLVGWHVSTFTWHLLVFYCMDIFFCRTVVSYCDRQCGSKSGLRLSILTRPRASSSIRSGPPEPVSGSWEVSHICIGSRSSPWAVCGGGGGSAETGSDQHVSGSSSKRRREKTERGEQLRQVRSPTWGSGQNHSRLIFPSMAALPTATEAFRLDLTLVVIWCHSSFQTVWKLSSLLCLHRK